MGIEPIVVFHGIELHELRDLRQSVLDEIVALKLDGVMSQNE